MAKNDEAIDNGTLSIEDSIRELWYRAKNLTTSQRIEAIDQEMAKAYRLNKEIRDAIKQIQAQMAKGEQERVKNDPWKFVRNVAKFIVGEIDKR